MGRLKGICISEKRGTEKHEVREAMVKMDWGIEGEIGRASCRERV